MVAFAEQQLQRSLAQTLQARAVGDDLRAVHGRGGAGTARFSGCPRISTMHNRQPPHEVSPSDSTCVGMSILLARAISRMVLSRFAGANLAVDGEGNFIGCSHGFTPHQCDFAPLPLVLMSQRRQRKHSALACHSVKVGDTSGVAAPLFGRNEPRRIARSALGRRRDGLVVVRTSATTPRTGPVRSTAGQSSSRPSCQPHRGGDVGGAGDIIAAGVNLRVAGLQRPRVPP